MNKKKQKKELERLLNLDYTDYSNILLEYLKDTNDPAIIDNLLSIGSKDAILILQNFHRSNNRGYFNSQWLGYLEKELVKIQNWEVCYDLMFDDSSPYKNTAKSIILNHPNWKFVIKNFPKDFMEKFEQHRYPSNFINESQKKVWKFTLSYISKEEIKNLIVKLEEKIKKIDEDKDYYLTHQIYGDDSNYDWNKAKSPIREWVEYLKNLL